MLADTEAGSVISAAQSGAQWGYRLVALQFLLIPPLFLAQNLAARLGVGTRQGLAELVRNRLGIWPAVLLLATLVVSCAGALLTELSGFAGVGALYGMPAWQSVGVAVLGLLAVIWTGSFRAVERIAVAVGLCELAFLALAWMARPDAAEMAGQMVQMPLGDPGYLHLVAANLGTCVIPWAIFYQQSASVDKGLNRSHLGVVRVETLVGAVLCQVITSAIVVAAAAAFGRGEMPALDRIGDIATAFGLAIGPLAGQVVFVAGLLGGALVAAIVVCLTVAWAFGEVLGLAHTLGERPARAPWYCGSLTVLLVAAGVLVASGVPLVRLAIGMGALNAVLLPVVLGFLYYLGWHELPADLRLRGLGAAVVAVVFALTAGLGLFAGIAGLL